MYKQFGGSALLFVFLSAFVSNYGGALHSSSDGSSKAGSAVTKQASSKDENAFEMNASNCAAAEIFSRHYGLPKQQGLRQGDLTNQSGLACDESAFIKIPFEKVNKGSSLGRVIIATVPDPLQTSDALEFDRNVEAYQEAVSACGYDFEFIITDWDVSNLEEPKDTDAASEAERNRKLFGDQPGAMLFHKRPASDGELKANVGVSLTEQFLVLLLIPESPTYGLNMHASREALAALGELRNAGFSSGLNPSSNSVIWVGPNYSASAYSLEHIAREYPFLQFHAFSGSITSRAALDTLKRVDSDTSLLDNQVSALDADDLALHAIRESKVLGTKNPVQIALLQEDESAYGAGGPIPNKTDGSEAANSAERIRDTYQTPVYHFPRGISHIRGIFGGQLTNFRPGANPIKNQDVKSTFDLADGLQQPLDSAPEFAVQSPYSNESVLAAIASSMVHREVDAVVILATDPLDQLFLARYYHQKVPNARIIIFNADRLLPELRGQYDLDGVLTVTRFPLFEDSYLQTPSIARHPLTFTNSTQEGVFFATLHQLEPQELLEAIGPNSAAMRPIPIWVGISSGGSFWPVAETGKLEAVDSKKYTASNSYVITNIPSEPLPRLWSLIAALALLCAAIHLTLFLAARPLNPWLASTRYSWTKILASHRALTFYLPDGASSTDRTDISRETGRRYWLVSATGQIVLVLSYILLPAFFLLGLNHDVPTFGLNHLLALRNLSVFGSLAGLLYLSSILLLLYLAIDLVQFCIAKRQYKQWSILINVLILLSILLTWLSGTLIVFVQRLSEASHNTAFAIRCVHLTSNVSPALPLLLASLGFITAAIVNLNALGLARDRNPHMPDVPMEILKLGPCKEQLASYIECWGPLPNLEGLTLPLCILITCCIANPFELFGSVDGAGMSLVFTLNVVFGLWTIAWLWLRFLKIWRLLRFILESLESSTLRFAFSRLPKIFSLAPIWSYAGLRRTLILPMRWFEYFKVAPRTSDYKEHFDKESIWLTSVAGKLLNDQALVDGEYVHFSKDQNEYAAELAASLPSVKASWLQGGRDAQIADDKGPQSEVTEHDGLLSRLDVPTACRIGSDPDCAVAIANEYIAMRFGAYVRYVTLQLKNLMTFMSVGLLLFLLATVSYAFREPQNIAWSLAIIVVILLVGVGKVLVQMDRDSILSRMSETPPGKVDRSAFIWHMLSVGGLPAITALSALFPEVGNFLFSWLQPVLSALH